MAMEQYSKLKLTFDEVTGAMKFAGQEAVSLQKQVRLLRQELTLGSYTKEQFVQIQRALQETEVKLQQSQLRGKELFQQIGTLGGPIGEFANRVDHAIKLLGALSQMSFEELKQQFRTIGLILSGNVDKISETIEVAQTGGRLPGMRESTGSAGEAGGGLRTAGQAVEAGSEVIQAKRITKTTEALNQQTKAYSELSNAILLNSDQIRNNMVHATNAVARTKEWYEQQNKLRTITKNLENNFKDFSFVVDNGVVKIGMHDAALRELSEAELAAAASGKKLMINQQGQIVTSTLLTRVTNSLSAAVTALGAAMSILIVGGIIATIGALYLLWKKNTLEAVAAQEMFNKEIENTLKILELDEAAMRRRQSIRIAEMKRNNATEINIRKEQTRNVRDQYNQVVDALNEAIDEENQAMKNISDKGNMWQRVFGVDEETRKLLDDNYNKAVANRVKLEEKASDLFAQIEIDRQGTIDLILDTARQNRLRDLDAKIENEIFKENTSTKELEKLYRQRNILVDTINKDITLSNDERLERTRQQTLKINNAIIDDNVRVIQAEIDKYKRLEDVAIKGTDDAYEARKKIAQETFNKEYEEAKRDDKTRVKNQENARTKFWLTTRQIEIQRLQDIIELNKKHEGEQVDNTQAFFDAMLKTEESNYELELKLYEGNLEEQRNALKSHNKRVNEIKAKQFDYEASLNDRQSQIEFQKDQNKEAYTLLSLFTRNNAIRKINQLSYEDSVKAENQNYEARRLRAAGNAKELEIIETEHNQNLRNLAAQRVETEKQVTLAIEQVTIQFGQTLNSIGTTLMAEQQGRDEKKFKQAKKMAVAGIIIEKAAAIGQIWTNNAIANAKATATFWATGGQPWVTINTISAILSTAATVAAAAQAISQINGTQFEGGGKESGNMLGRNYEKGGYIEGKRHAQGGVMIEAEGGEAVMTRGAVTMFAPLLSAMNQMGGGTSFAKGAVGMSSFDNPSIQNSPSQAPIIKTYIVSNEMKSEMEKQERLKDLSTL